ncbi:hypothetical protein ACR78J_05160 [Sphingobacterium spiritivorum]|uniref:hypothetical protein n=2 Tax=Sphingobacterium spiritivorum TaxID=258 RepID=UPI003DA26B31
MKIKNIAVAGLLLFVLSLSSCAMKKGEPQEQEGASGMQKTVKVTGRITEIVKGKDGYTATLNTTDGSVCYAMISIVNLQKGNSTYKSHEVGETITVSGESWKDTEGKMYITVRELK